MEVVGLTFGAASLVGLYSACMEAVDRIASYRHFGSDRQQLLTQIDANKDIFQRWAKRVGISAEGLLNLHDSHLDNENTAKVVGQILTCIRDVFGDSGQANHRTYQHGNQNTLSVPKRLGEPSIQSESQAPSRKRDRWAWTLHGKSKLESQVRKFTYLVEMLDRLVPSFGSSNDKDLNYQLRLINLKGNLLWKYLYSRIRRY